MPRHDLRPWSAQRLPEAQTICPRPGLGKHSPDLGSTMVRHLVILFKLSMSEIDDYLDYLRYVSDRYRPPPPMTQLGFLPTEIAPRSSALAPTSGTETAIRSSTQHSHEIQRQNNPSAPPSILQSRLIFIISSCSQSPSLPRNLPHTEYHSPWMTQPLLSSSPISSCPTPFPMHAQSLPYNASHISKNKKRK